MGSSTIITRGTLFVFIIVQLWHGINGEKTSWIDFMSNPSHQLVRNSSPANHGDGFQKTAVVNSKKKAAGGRGSAAHIGHGRMGRVQRQVERNGAVIGIRVQRDLEAVDYARIKVVAGRIARPERQVRQINGYNLGGFGGHNYREYYHQEWSHTYGTTQYSPSITNMQIIFSNFNFNVKLADILWKEYMAEFSGRILPAYGAAGIPMNAQRIRAVERLLVINPRGVTCGDVCDSTGGDGIGYGTIGICTPQYCECDFSSGQFTRLDCTQSSVFDPVSRSCNSPRNVVLCNDEPYIEPLPWLSGNSGAFHWSTSHYSSSSSFQHNKFL